MLVGRSRECEVIDDLLSAASRGKSGALVLRGGTGVGKSALLAHAISRAGGFLILTATGVESETEFAFSGLHELLLPVLDRLDRIPDVQADALRGALALTVPAHVGRMYVGAASLSLISAAGDDGPVVCVIDDAQWLDRASLEALLFAARRVKAEGIAMLFAVNDDVESFPTEGLPQLSVRGLADADAAALLRSRTPLVADTVVTHLVSATEGNPLFLVQLPTTLSREQLTGQEPVPHPLPVGQRLSEWYATKLQGLSTDGRRAVVLAAASDTGGLGVLTPSSERQHDDALLEAEDAGFLAVDDGRVRFPHPVVRSAVYLAASPGERRAAHRRLAELFATQPRYQERRAWHLAAATTGADDQVAAEIAEVASSAASRRAHVPAAALFQRAADLTNDPSTRARWLTQAAWSSRLAGRGERASTLAAAAIADSDEPAIRARARSVAALVSIDAGEVVDATELLADLEAVVSTDPELAAGGFAIASETVKPERALELAESAQSLAPSGSAADAFATVARGRALARLGRPEQASTTTAQAASLLRDHPALMEDPEVLVAIVDGLAEVGADLGSTEEMLTIASRAAREHTLVVLPRALVHRSRLEHRRGRWRDALVHGYEAARLFRETRQATRSYAADAWLGYVEAAFGHEEAVEAIMTSLGEHEQELGPSAGLAVARIQGTLAMTLGRPERAAGPLRRWVLGGGARPLLPLDPVGVADAVETSVHAGDADEASTFGSRILDDHADAEACAAWIEAMTGEDSGGADVFDRAMELASRLRTSHPYLLARVCLSAGERVRRNGEMNRAREHLHEALSLFTGLDATPWLERAARELRATGERVDRVGGSSLDDLTPQELAVARVIAEGATYKEAAARLYLAPKTIEFHLGKVYRKLGIRSGKELPTLFMREEAPP